MSDPSVISNLVKAADIAKSVSTKALHNVPMVLALCFILAVLGLAPGAFVPKAWSGHKEAFLIVSLFLAAYLSLQWWFAWRPLRYLKWHCRNLASDERIVLVAYLKEDASLRYYSAWYGPTCVLMSKGILVFASKTFDAFDAPIMIQPRARIYLRKHPDLLGLKVSDLGSEKPRGKRKGRPPLQEE